ncbi:MBOAT family protein [Lacrimispora sp. NSJ-141]|uniref:MBOAT family protein n=1 Tax=Lientehia hominis TaxID=2897778 RepID=A0AAP2RJR5_9FIRM|nr:MBOAT family O-acyltransferase [Lientehia hominis]MCD2493156.1 MBOAT family protein [Lientehia hominis]
MSYSTGLYLLCFLPCTTLLYYLIPLRFRFLVLLASSFLFYLLGNGSLPFFLLLSTLIVYSAALLMNRLGGREKKKKKRLLWGSLLLLFGLLFFFKYFNFFSRNVNLLLGRLSSGGKLPILSLLLPMGISFYTLQAASYLIDVSRGKYPADRNFGRFLLYMCFFPHIMEGPIARYDQLGTQVYEGHPFSYENITGGLQLILWGLFKKLVIADRANMFVNTVFESWQNYHGFYVLAAALLYTLQLYAEFSGCMDIAAGSAQIFGIQLAENFRHPFSSRSINEFWQRWHISLGSWLRDYVFYGVSLSRPFKRLSQWARKRLPAHLAKWFPVTCALFLVWFGNGMWHGASWKYIFYGLYYFFLLSLGTLLDPLFRNIPGRLGIGKNGRAYRGFQRIRTFSIVVIGMLLFRAASLKTGIKMVFSIFRGFSLSVLTDGSILRMGCDGADLIVLSAGLIIMAAAGHLKERGKNLRGEIAALPLPVRWAIYYSGIFSVLILGAYGTGYAAVDFIYAHF